MQDYPITEEERAYAEKVLADDNGGAGLDVHMRAYFGFLAHPAPGFHPVRNVRGHITGYRDDAVTDLIEHHRGTETAYQIQADNAPEPEMREAHGAAAQCHRLAALTHETSAAYNAQTFRLDAVGWENLMPDNLATVYAGKSNGLYPAQRARRDAEGADSEAARLIETGRKNLADRLQLTAWRQEAAGMTDADLQAAITLEKDNSASSRRFLVLTRESDTRSEAVRKAKNKAMKTLASDTPWTAVEERMFSATAPQTARMTPEQLEGHREACKPSPTRTRHQQLMEEAVRREVARRAEAAVTAQAVLDRLPKFTRGSVGYGLKMHDGAIVDPVAGRRLQWMDVEELRDELVAVTTALQTPGVRFDRGVKTQAYNYNRVLRKLIEQATEQ